MIATDDIVAVSGQTESGDDLPILLFYGELPSEDEINAAYRELIPEEFDEDGEPFFYPTTSGVVVVR